MIQVIITVDLGDGFYRSSWHVCTDGDQLIKVYEQFGSKVRITVL